jgi:hypothetical protein
MGLEIDRTKLKIKHFLDIQQETVGYPSLEDFLYEMIIALAEHDLTDEFVGTQFIKSRCCSSAPKEKHEEFYNELVKLGYLKINEDALAKNRSTTYKLIKHPWMKD